MTTYQYIMQKYGLKRHREYFLEIPDMNRDDLAKLFSEVGFVQGAEIGVERGHYSKVLCESIKNVELYCIDPWSVEAYEPGIHAVDYEQEKWEEYYQETKERLKPYNAHVMRMTSTKAAKLFPDNSLDFVYIDGNHDFLNVTQDIDIWKKKIRSGGILAGHDYAYFSFKKHNHVKRVIEAYMRCYRMIPYFVVGSYEYIEGQKRDKYRSWFWVKQ